jgi:type II secretory pathway component PulC
MFRHGRKAMKYGMLIFFTIMVWLLSAGAIHFVSAHKAAADSGHPDKEEGSRKTVYTIQTGSFRDSQRAEKQFRIIEQSLEEAALHALRIEKIGRFYAVRIGTFAGLAETEQFLRKHEGSLNGALMMKAYFIDERILLMHYGAEKVKTERKAGTPGMRSDRYLPDIPYAPSFLGLKLVGTALMDEPGNNIAIIENLASGDQEIYKQGDRLKGVLIKRILGRGLVIDEGHGDEILIMVGGKRTGRLYSETRRAGRRERAAETRVPSRSSMMRGVGIRPYLKEGRPIGFSIYNIESKSILAKLGLENCDVITAVNGNPVKVTQEPSHFYKAIKKGGEITIDIKRDDTDKKLSFEISSSQQPR